MLVKVKFADAAGSAVRLFCEICTLFVIETRCATTGLNVDVCA